MLLGCKEAGDEAKGEHDRRTQPGDDGKHAQWHRKCARPQVGGPTAGFLPDRSQDALGATRLILFRFHGGIIADGLVDRCPLRAQWWQVGHFGIGSRSDAVAYSA